MPIQPLDNILARVNSVKLSESFSLGRVCGYKKVILDYVLDLKLDKEIKGLFRAVRASKKCGIILNELKLIFVLIVTDFGRRAESSPA